ncbi:MAG: tRNA uridine-5-carboxymethylaminomethyl(34) synthesis GTPase MnmE [Candidatus Riflebacteria bacterium]|nr:tRNA uridine-5-carboxymethylaminomethyl(34) synthesis GTPase MnmE [Candidatus Riflebacteria bacterium]
MSKLKIDTIAALSTPAGRAAISLIRVSGPDTFEILKKVFKPGGKRAFPLHYSAYFGNIIEPDTGYIADQVIVNTYLSPKSYTGEDLAEISTHGNPVIVSKVLSILFKNGARQAEKGEFTRRAFLNGKMDLLEVEALSQLLYASSTTQTRLALNQLDGFPSKYIAKIRQELLDQLVQLEASLNFPEDSIESIDENALKIKLQKILSELSLFAENARNGSMISEGLKVAIVGKPNAGKSSLMNYLLGRDRAIVTNIPGTTRDTLEESLIIDSFPVKLIDTAGLRKAENDIEAIGIERTEKAIDTSFAVIGVFDGSQPPDSEDIAVLERLKSLEKPVLIVQNKSDLLQQLDPDFLSGLEVIKVSALKGEGMSQLISLLSKTLKVNGISSLEEMVLLGASQVNALDKALSVLKRAEEGIGNMYQDMLAIDLEEAVRELGRVNGETVDVNTLDMIFERFCIGK